MKPIILAWVAVLALNSAVFAGPHEGAVFANEDFEETRRFELGYETAVVFGINNIHDYVLMPQVVTLSWLPPEQPGKGRWQARRHWQIAAVVEPILQGPESLYTGIALGHRLRFGPKDAAYAYEITGRFGPGWIDSTDAPDAQGQDFTFVVMVNVGVRWEIGRDWNAFAGVMYHHLSNAGLSEPERKNVGLDAYGPVIAISRKF